MRRRKGANDEKKNVPLLICCDLLDIRTSVGEQDKQFAIINMSRHLCLAAAEGPIHFMRTKSK